MKKIIFLFAFIFFYFESVLAETKVKALLEGNIDAKISIIVYESLTCGHCADFHKKVYPKLKKDFIDTGLIKIEFIVSTNIFQIPQKRNIGNGETLIELDMELSYWRDPKQKEFSGLLYRSDGWPGTKSKFYKVSLPLN